MKLGLTTTTRSVPSPLLPAVDAPGGKTIASVPPSAVRRKLEERTSEPALDALPTSREEERGASEAKRRILDAAAKELAAKGLDRARLGAIARAAGVPQALVRRHFADKEGLHAAVVEGGLAVVIEAASGLLARMDAPVAARKGKKRRGPAELRALAEAFVDLLVGLFADGAWLSSVLRHDARRERAPGAGRAAATIVADGARPVFDAIVARLEEMRARGEIRRDVDAKHLLLSCVAMIAFPFQDEPLVTAFWPIDWHAPAHLAERKRDMVELILARVLP